MKFAADENFNNDIVRGIVRRRPKTDIVRVQDFGLGGADDPQVLAWAASEGRALLTHDAATMTTFAYDRVAQKKRMPGLFEVASHLPVRDVIDDIILLAECSLEDEWEGQVIYLPLR